MADRERELEAQRVVYISSDLYPDGEFVPELEARLSVFDRGYTIGDSVYEYGRTYRHSPFQVEEHMDRMFTSLKTLRINPGVTHEEFCALCKEVTMRNMPLLEDYEEYNIVWEVTRGAVGVARTQAADYRRGRQANRHRQEQPQRPDRVLPPVHHRHPHGDASW